jgi:hypothetical protein
MLVSRMRIFEWMRSIEKLHNQQNICAKRSGEKKAAPFRARHNGELLTSWFVTLRIYLCGE